MTIQVKWLLTRALLCGITCACAQGDNGELNLARPIVADAVILVENQRSEIVAVYVATDRLTDVLGNVSRNSARSFSIPSAIARSANELHLEARSSQHGLAERSSRFQLSPGVRVVWTIGREGQSVISLH